MDIYKIVSLLTKFQKIPKPIRAKTFFEIAGFPHYENVCSNVLQFFFQPNNEHGLKDLFLKSLLECVKEDNTFDFTKVYVEREVFTELHKRLDILITTDKHIIGIENKIFHFLNNDLEDYSKFITSKANMTDKKAIKVVLSLYNLSQQVNLQKWFKNGFINITYDTFFEQIKMNLGKYVLTCNTTYYLLFTDFIKSIQNLKPRNMEDKELWSFFGKNAEMLQELTLSFSKYKEELYQKVNRLNEIMSDNEIAKLAPKPWIWDGRKEKEGYERRALVYDYTFDKYTISVDTVIDIVNGWQIQLFGRDGSTDYLFDKVVIEGFLPKSVKEFKRGERIIIFECEHSGDLQEIVNNLNDILKRLNAYKDSVK